MAEKDSPLLEFDKSKTLAERIREKMAEKNITRADLLRRIKNGGENSTSGYSGDALTSNVLKISNALNTNLDKLLGVKREPLSAEVQEVLDQILKLDIEDQWLALDLLKAILKRNMIKK